MADTIYALASARGKAGVAVVRLSGPQSRAALERLAGPVAEPRRTHLRRLVQDGGILDEALVLRFEAGASFTGEAAAELHLHGGPATVSAVLGTLAGLPGLRPAEPGEFTRRALENGNLDLTQVEALADLIDAETEAQRRQALRVLSGETGARASAWRRDIVRAAALVEATIDFADEDVPVDVMPEVRTLVAGLLGALETELAGARAAERLRDGFEVAIVGAPNAGKSTLLNRLAGRQAALVSVTPGTTRDVIEVRMDLGGLPVTFLDTAGLREAVDPVEQAGIALARRRADAADLRVILVGPGEDPPIETREDDLIVGAKADLRPGAGLRVSGLTGDGIPDLLDRITEVLAARVVRPGVLVRERHRLAVGRAVAALRSAGQSLASQAPSPEILAEDLRQAARALDELIGRVATEDLLGEIFASFCIGK